MVLQTVDAGIAALYGLSVNSGALVSSVAPNSPAANAGLQANDVLVQVDGITVSTASQGADALQATQIGKPVKITYWRGKSQYSVEITPIQNPQL